ncbi:duodenase-1 [Erpetoichthys calabaricus]|uniref:Duodenase-1-like n=1 Tax=Erpetoichthys calabaricus TaxID=27687 RepID=A0A8C4SWS4_ERPCA|nr:duodenase-1 [Erpetoichthys calabaricus]
MLSQKEHQTLSMDIICLIATFLSLVPSIFKAERTGSSIIRGHEAKPHSHPYMAYIVDRVEKRTCGGFLVREDFVMTAAHCNGQSLIVLLGAHNLKHKEPSQVFLEVEQSFPHPNFNIENATNDIMLLKLKNQAALNSNIKVLALPDCEVDLEKKTPCVICGWGNTVSQKIKMPQTLQEANVTIISRKKCNKRWDGGITETMICTKSRVVGCKGDSGGPLVCNGVAQGIISFGPKNCGVKHFPGVYTRITAYKAWIESIMKSREH